jgi:uncharacterized protein
LPGLGRGHDVDVDDARRGLGSLDEDACRVVLGTATVGRLALSVRALPVVVPVNFVVRGGELFLGLGAGEGLEAACDGTVVAFQVDGVDKSTEVGWSVLVQGRSRLLQPDDPRVAAARGVSTVWADPGPHLLVIVGMDLVSGHHLGHGPFGSGFALSGSRGPS